MKLSRSVNAIVGKMKSGAAVDSPTFESDVFEKRDGIEGAFDAEAEGMLEVGPEPNLILPLRTDDVNEVRYAFATLRCFCRTLALASDLMKQLPGNSS